MQGQPLFRDRVPAVVVHEQAGPAGDWALTAVGATTLEIIGKATAEAKPMRFTTSRRVKPSKGFETI